MNKIVARRREQTLPPVHPSAGVEVAYRRALDEIIGEMHRSLIYWLRAGYRANEPEVLSLAQDESPARRLDRIMRRLAARWVRRFNRLAPELARGLANGTAQRSTDGLKAALKKSGFAIEFKMTQPMNDAYQAVIAENVGLIKSIAQEHLAEVQGLVMRSVQRGADLGTLTNELEARYGVTRRRAALIARDQNSKATAILVRVRQAEVGVTEAIWMHSHGGKVPRPSHVAADGKKYEIRKGMYLDGEWIIPGQLINCRCVCRPILPGAAGQRERDRLAA